MGLPDSPLDFLEIDLFPAPGQFAAGQLLERNCSVFQHWQGAAFEFSIALHHPQHADGMKKFLLPLRLVFAPELNRARRDLRIRLVWSVCSAHYAGLTARRRSRAARSPCIEECDASTATKKIERRPSAEGAPANHCNMRSVIHEFRSLTSILIHRRGRQSAERLPSRSGYSCCQSRLAAVPSGNLRTRFAIPVRPVLVFRPRRFPTIHNKKMAHLQARRMTVAP